MYSFVSLKWSEMGPVAPAGNLEGVNLLVHSLFLVDPTRSRSCCSSLLHCQKGWAVVDSILTTHDGHEQGIQLLNLLGISFILSACASPSYLSPVVRVVRITIFESNDLLGFWCSMRSS